MNIIIKVLKVSGKKESDNTARANIMSFLLNSGFNESQIKEIGPGNLNYDFISIEGKQDSADDVILFIATK